MRRNSQHGVALVITLIMLSVITVMAVTFLALTRRDRATVAQASDLRDSHYANSAGLERAKAQIVADILAGATNGNWLGPDFMVSRNYINVNGFDPTLPGYDPISVNYDYTATNPRRKLNANESLQNIANLLYDPRPPVFVRTNLRASAAFQTPANTNDWDFRYFLNLNRNAEFEDTGILPILDDTGTVVRDASGNDVVGLFVGDPQWIGILERPNLPHSAANKFIGRYCFVIVPAGKTLDINFIHNQAKRLDMTQIKPGFLRNDGFATYENNLAAFFADLNTNVWNPVNNSYRYITNLSIESRGAAFWDATELLVHRYAPVGWNGTQSPDTYLDTVRALFGPVGAQAFDTDGIDGYADGNFNGALGGLDTDDSTRPWSGAGSKKHFFTLHDFFNPTTARLFPVFNSHLIQASTARSSLGRYTYYDMLSQLGTDSTPEPADKININYDNQVLWSANGPPSATNFYSWSATNFFMTVADRLLKDQLRWERSQRFTNLPDDVGITNIQIFPTNFYTPTVHRLLQTAVNVFDATTNRPGRLGLVPYPYYPTALRPVFMTTNDNNLRKVLIVGYEEVPFEPPGSGSGSGLPTFAQQLVNSNNWKDLNDLRGQTVQRNDFIYGIPLLIGARQGFPNFNELMVETTAQLERKAEVVKEDPTRPFPRYTNQLYVLGVSNVIGLEAWNSYGNDTHPLGYYPRDLVLFAACETTTIVTNEDGVVWRHDFATNSSLLMRASVPAERWTNLTFRFPMQIGAGTNWIESMALTNSLYLVADQGFKPTYDKPTFENSRVVGFWGNQFVAVVTNRIRYFLFDDGRLVDAVSFAGLGTTMNIASQLHPIAMWNTNRLGNSTARNQMTVGLQNQIVASMGGAIAGLSASDWLAFGNTDNRDGGQAGFRGFLDPTNRTRKSMQAPYSPVMKVMQRTTWQVNDPLVHYLAQDFLPKVEVVRRKRTEPRNNDNLGDTNEVYQPWGSIGPRKSISSPEDHLKAHNYAVKDPRVSSSDRWNFPTNKFPNIGWLGRVHRGTPWQTVYLKSDMAPTNEWLARNPTLLSHPTNDWRLADIFTVAQHPNASRGQLSVNQTNEPAWSAILTGVEVQTLRDQNGNPVLEDYLIQPVALEPYVSQIVAGINAQREKLPGKRFTSLSQFLAVTNLTTGSPYLNEPFITPDSAAKKLDILDDEDYERIPQKILSLLRVGDTRYVIYSWGQALKPAHVINSGQFRGMVDNYQISGEVATRAVVRIDFEPSNNLTNLDAGVDYRRPRAVVESFNILPPD